ncbi:Hypothetical protein D9617_4g003060 [Elsinoe fawcettii]|nr:Hypothetical protein D9617_4g003060 [Elsinoe fawcettii]
MALAGPNNYSLASVPTELLDLIFSFLHKIEDVRNLCLCSKALYDAGLPHLYYCVRQSFNTKQKMSDYLESLGQRKQHVREICLYHECLRERCESLDEFLEALREAELTGLQVVEVRSCNCGFRRPELPEDELYAVLTTLQLERMDFVDPVKSAAIASHLHGLTNLVLDQCRGTIPLFEAMAQPMRAPIMLQKIELVLTTYDDSLVLALDEFLLAAESLVTFLLGATSDAPFPSVEGFIKHRHSLKTLRVQICKDHRNTAFWGPYIMDQKERTWPIAQLQTLCAEMTELEELACAFPMIDMLAEVPSEEWCCFLVIYLML